MKRAHPVDSVPFQSLIQLIAVQWSVICGRGRRGGVVLQEEEEDAKPIARPPSRQ